MPGDSPSPAPICTIEYGRFRLRAPLPVFLPDFERRILMRGAPATVDTAFYRSQPAPDPSHPLSEYQYLQKKRRLIPPDSRKHVPSGCPAGCGDAASSPDAEAFLFYEAFQSAAKKIRSGIDSLKIILIVKVSFRKKTPSDMDVYLKEKHHVHSCKNNKTIDKHECTFPLSTIIMH